MHCLRHSPTRTGPKRFEISRQQFSDCIHQEQIVWGIIVTLTTSISLVDISFTKQQFVVTHTIRQTDIPALVDSSVTNTSSVKMLYAQKKCFNLYLPKNVTSLKFGILMICRVFSVSCKAVYLWVTKDCRFVSTMLRFHILPYVTSPLLPCLCLFSK